MGKDCYRKVEKHAKALWQERGQDVQEIETMQSWESNPGHLQLRLPALLYFNFATTNSKVNAI